MSPHAHGGRRCVVAQRLWPLPAADKGEPVHPVDGKCWRACVCVAANHVAGEQQQYVRAGGPRAHRSHCRCSVRLRAANLNDGIVLVSTTDPNNDDNGTLVCLNATDGSQMWTLRANDHNATVTYGLRYIPAIDQTYVPRLVRVPTVCRPSRVCLLLFALQPLRRWLHRVRAQDSRILTGHGCYSQRRICGTGRPFRVEVGVPWEAPSTRGARRYGDLVAAPCVRGAACR
jgi:hypothetical protein